MLPERFKALMVFTSLILLYEKHFELTLKQLKSMCIEFDLSRNNIYLGEKTKKFNAIYMICHRLV